MKHPRFLLALACAASFTCTESDDAPGPDEPDAEEPVSPPTVEAVARWDGGHDAPGEVIHIEDGAPGSQGGAPWGPGHSGANPTGGDGGGGTTGGPGDQPARKTCSRDQGLDACLDCCYYNHDKVDGWKCRKIKGDSERQRRKRKDCWEKAVQEQSRCQVEDCGRDRPIITATWEAL